MTLFRDTDAAAEFIATADSRNTSPEVMRAIAHYANDAAEACEMWDGTAAWCGLGADVEDIIWAATGQGTLHGAALHWGDRTLDQIMSDEEGA